MNKYLIFPSLLFFPRYFLLSLLFSLFIPPSTFPAFFSSFDNLSPIKKPFTPSSTHLVLLFSLLPSSVFLFSFSTSCLISWPLLLSPSHLQKGNLDEINSHFSNFHSYRPPNYSEEVWEQVSADNVCLMPKAGGIPGHRADTERDALMVPCDLPPVAAHHQITTPNPGPYMQSLSPYCFSPPRTSDVASPWSRPEVVALPGSEYSMMGHTGVSGATPAPGAPPTNSTQQDFYTCVQLMNESGAVHLVPCLPPAYCREFPPPPLPKADSDAKDEEEEKRKKLADYQARKSAAKDGGEAERNKVADARVSVAVDNQG